MQTRLSPQTLATREGQRAEEILRACVHCGFCNAVCPTYQLLGDELDGPRGRIYLIKELLEADAAQQPALADNDDVGDAAEDAAQAQVASVAQPFDPGQAAVAMTHLDRCLTCRACETACPSGVAYGELLEIGREQLEPQVERGWTVRLKRWLLLRLVPYPARLAPWLRILNALSPVLRRLPWRMGGVPVARLLPPLKAAAPVRHARPSRGGDAVRVRAEPGLGNGAEDSKPRSSGRKVLVLQGCIQRLSTPEANQRLTALLSRAGVQAVQPAGEGCCGGLSLHLGEGEQARQQIRENLRALQPHLEGVEAILSTASGCGVTVKDYGRLLADDPAWAELATQVSALTLDAAQYLRRLDLPLVQRRPWRRIAWMPSCTLQHGQRVRGDVEALLQSAGYELVAVPDAHLCCGAAGSYAVMQPELSGELRTRKLRNLMTATPEAIATANIGCQLHLHAGTDTPVVHYLELIG